MIDDQFCLILFKYEDDKFWALLLEDMELGRGRVPIERVREAIRLRGVSGSNWGTALDLLSPDDYEAIGLRLFAYIPFPVIIDHDEVIVEGPLTLEDIPF